MRFEISAKLFLFGGDVVRTNLYEERYIDGFHTLDIRRDESKEIYKSFEAFKRHVTDLLGLYAWDADEGITVDREETGPHIQKFDVPDDTTLNQWFTFELENYQKEKMEYIITLIGKCHADAIREGLPYTAPWMPTKEQIDYIKDTVGLVSEDEFKEGLARYRVLVQWTGKNQIEQDGERFGVYSI